MKLFTDESLYTIHEWLAKQADQSAQGEQISFGVIDPDRNLRAYAGTKVTFEGREYIHRPLQCYLDLAMQFNCIAKVPQKNGHLVIISMIKQRVHSSFHSQSGDKYGKDSPFFRVEKNEQTSFLHYYLRALRQSGACEAASVLNLGVHRGTEFAPLQRLCGRRFAQMKLQGVDRNADALAQAERDYPGTDFYHHDINDLARLGLQKSDLFISIGTLHSPGIDFDAVLRYVVKDLLHTRAGVILGFPNCRWIDGQMVYGAKMKNYDFSEMSLVLKDMIFAKRYLQKKGFKVLTFGKDYLFVCAFRG